MVWGWCLETSWIFFVWIFGWYLLGWLNVLMGRKLPVGVSWCQIWQKNDDEQTRKSQKIWMMNLKESIQYFGVPNFLNQASQISILATQLWQKNPHGLRQSRHFAGALREIWEARGNCWHLKATYCHTQKQILPQNTCQQKVLWMKTFNHQVWVESIGSKIPSTAMFLR